MGVEIFTMQKKNKMKKKDYLKFWLGIIYFVSVLIGMSVLIVIFAFNMEYFIRNVITTLAMMVIIAGASRIWYEIIK